MQDSTTRQNLVQRARTGFDRAVQLNPLLKNQYGKYMTEVAALAP
jgi:hypothetical protein